jgi:hypothetical protein
VIAVCCLFGGGREEMREDEIMCEGVSRVGYFGRAQPLFLQVEIFLEIFGLQNERLIFLARYPEMQYP